MTDAVTVVLTSCARFDLLERGLRSFFEKNTYPIERFLLIEDSGDETAREIAKAVDESIEVHVAAVRRGQSASIDYAYGLVETPYIFHTEEDYFYLRGGFIEDGLRILKAHDAVSVVSGEGFQDRQRTFNGLTLPVKKLAGVDVLLPPRSLHPGWYGYAFHPGLRRKREWERFGPFAPYRREWDVSYTMKRAGMHMAYLAIAAYDDDDGGYSVGALDPVRKRKGWGRKLHTIRKSLKKYFFYLERALGRYDDTW